MIFIVISWSFSMKTIFHVTQGNHKIPDRERPWSITLYLIYLSWLVYGEMCKMMLRMYIIQLSSETYRPCPYCLLLAVAVATAGCRVRKNNVDHFHKVHRCAVIRPPEKTIPPAITGRYLSTNSNYRERVRRSKESGLRRVWNNSRVYSTMYGA